MLGAAGILLEDIQRTTSPLVLPLWTEAAKYNDTFGWDATTLALSMIPFFAWAEGRRWADIVKPGSTNTDPIFGYKLKGTDVGYPGFDPAGMGYGSAEAVKTIRQKELKNGRLAMVGDFARREGGMHL